jgi:hypothetical protein
MPPTQRQGLIAMVSNFKIICYGADGDVGGEGYDADIASTK